MKPFKIIKQIHDDCYYKYEFWFGLLICTGMFGILLSLFIRFIIKIQIFTWVAYCSFLLVMLSSIGWVWFEGWGDDYDDFGEW